MVSGHFKCFGSAQHIKDKFGDGYELEVKIKIPSLQEIEELREKLGYTPGNLLAVAKSNRTADHVF